MVLELHLTEACLQIQMRALLLEFLESTADRFSRVGPHAPLLDQALNCVAGLGLQQVFGGNSLMLEPSGDVSPGPQVLLLLNIANDLGRACDVLFLNDSLLFNMIVLQLLRLGFRHLNHF